MKKNNLYVVIIVLVGLVLGFLVGKFTNCNKTTSNNKIPNYVLRYYDGIIPGTNYVFAIYDEEIKMTLSTDTVTEEVKSNFTKETVKKLNEFIKRKSYNNEFITDIEEKNQSKEEMYPELYELFESLSKNDDKAVSMLLEEYSLALEIITNEDTKYFIYYKEDNSILAKKQSQDSTNEYTINFSEENKNKVINTLNNIKENNNKSYLLYDYSNKEFDLGNEIDKTIKSIINNDENILNELPLK